MVHFQTQDNSAPTAVQGLNHSNRNHFNSISNAQMQIQKKKQNPSSYKAPNAQNVYFLTHKVIDLHSIKV